MKNLKFKYVMKTIFVDEIVNHKFTLKCVPSDSSVQKISDLSIKVVPETVMYEDKDAFGNNQLYGHQDNPHDIFVVRVEGRAQVTGEAERLELKDNEYIYKYQSKYTQLIYGLKDYFMGIYPYAEKMPSELEKAIYLCDCVYNNMDYKAGSTGIDTKAWEAWTIKRGVCQDYAHILIAFLRECKIPARYVVGMMMGEGASHAWVEAHIDGCWYGFDPTNHKMTDDTYIKISHGRDYADCIVEKGIFAGNGNQSKIVGIKVEE